MQMKAQNAPGELTKSGSPQSCQGGSGRAGYIHRGREGLSAKQLLDF